MPRNPQVDPVQHLHSDVPGVVPCPEELSDAEVAINTADGIAYFRDAGGRVRVLNDEVMALIAAQRAFAMHLIHG